MEGSPLAVAMAFEVRRHALGVVPEGAVAALVEAPLLLAVACVITMDLSHSPPWNIGC